MSLGRSSSNTSRSSCRAVRDGMRLGPSDAFVHEPVVQLVIALDAQARREEALAHEADLVLDLALLPARPRRAGDRLDEVVRGTPAALSQFNVVDVRSSPFLEQRQKFMLRAVETAHAGVGFHPDDQVERLEAQLCRGGRDRQLTPPVDEGFRLPVGEVRPTICARSARSAPSRGPSTDRANGARAKSLREEGDPGLFY
jgi:hypothetical protein